MPKPAIVRGSDQFFINTYEGNGQGQRVGNFVPFTDNGTIAKSVMVDHGSSSYLERTQDTVSGDDNKRKATFSCWFKPSGKRFGNETCLFGAAPSGRLFVRFDTSNRLVFRLTNSTTEYEIVTNRTFEDTSKFYHLLWQVDASQGTAANRSRVWIDGSEITSWSSAAYPAQNTDVVGLADGTVFRISSLSHSATQFFDGYIAEFNCVSGSIVDVSTFGLTDTSTGRWIPKTLTGITYGTNGFRCTFANSAGQTIGDDTSGNGNDLTLNGIGTDHIKTDSPTSNFTNMSGDKTDGTISEGGLKTVVPGSGAYEQIVALESFGVATGKWYWEVRVDSKGKSGLGWKSDSNRGGSQALDSGGNLGTVYNVGASGGFADGEWTDDYTSATSNFSTFTTASNGDIVQFALDLDNRKGYVGINNTYFNSANPSNGTGSIGLGKDTIHAITSKFYPMCLRLDSSGTFSWNFGQNPSFNGNITAGTATASSGPGLFKYTPPTDFLALCQDNLPTPDKGVPDFVWVKNRDNGNRGHQLYDSTRGTLKTLYSNGTNAESTNDDSLQKFIKGGFAAEDFTGLNEASESHVAWNWVANGGTTSANTDGSGATIASTIQANQTAGFSIVKYTGTGSAGTIAHGIGAVPTFIATKNYDDTASWYVYINGSHSGDPNTLFMRFDSDDGQDAGGSRWNDTTPTSSVFSVGGDDETNKNTKKFVAYCWADIPGYSKAGKYTGNGNADGPFIHTGFKPKLVMIKGLNIGNNWIVWDTERSKINPCDDALYWDLTQAAATSGNDLDILSNGFKCRGTNSNYNGSYSYGFLAFAENPFVGDGTNPTTAR